MSRPGTRASRRRLTLCVALAGLAVPVGVQAGASAVPAPTAVLPATAAAAARAPLTNLDHLDFLTVSVAPPQQARHTTYRLGAEPGIGVLWTYAEPNPDGSYRYVGGGEYDAATDTWSQGAFNADDVTRAAVVYLRHWQQTGSASSRAAAYELLRGVTYLQTASGPDAGNVVLWMQPDGTLNPSAEPVELPDPSDSDASYWLARTVWALGEGYAAFAEDDPAFAAFLGDRLELALDAVDRQVLDRYGEYLRIDGQRAPAWLIADGADATAEAVLGLVAYDAAGGSARARTVLTRLGKGIAALSQGDARRWPFGAVRPWALSRSVWHAWGSQMPAALAAAGQRLDRRGFVHAAARDTFTFDPWLLTSGGPDNGRLPTRGDASQIAYGADSRLQSALATAEATDRRSARRLASVFAAWYFGANPAGEPMYDPATGRTFDGISSTGEINRNSGAESTIHGLLSMLALDEHPGVAARARASRIVARVGSVTVEAEDAALTGDAAVVAPESLWTEEALFSGTGYVALGTGGSATFTLPQHGRSVVMPVLELRPGSDAVTRFTTGERVLGRTSSRTGGQGDSPAPGVLLPRTLRRVLPAGSTQVVATGRSGGSARLDALVLEPLVSRLVLVSGRTGDRHGTVLLRSASRRAEQRTVRVPGEGRTRVETFDGLGRLVSSRLTTAAPVRVEVQAGGFAVLQR